MKVACSDAGFECDYVAEGKSPEDIYDNLVKHAEKQHNYKPLDFSSPQGIKQHIANAEKQWKSYYEKESKIDFRNMKELSKKVTVS
jgi:predicted small metal-binding protein